MTAASASLLLHLVAMALLFLAGYSIPPLVQNHPVILNAVPLRTIFAPRRPASGGDRFPLPPRQGRMPERPLRRVWIPPMTPRVDTPVLAVSMALPDSPELASANEVGDPLSRFPGGSGGPGGLLRVGVGPGDGFSQVPGGSGGPRAPATVTRQPRITRSPQPVYRPEPEYSEEARKARFQGSVLLSVEIGADGRTSQVRVVRSVGLGLDEKAVEAVMRWRFLPALDGDKPVAVPALIEVSFHLL